MKIVVTGIAGFLGSWIGEALINKGHEVVGIDNMLGGYEDNVPKEVEFYKGDAADIGLMSKITKDANIIFHLAASPHEGLSVFSPSSVAYHTYMTTVGVYVAAVNNNVDRVVFTSSMARYGENKVPFAEDMTPNPKDPYGIAKTASEQILKIMKEAHGIDYVIAVPHNIIGARQKYDDPFRNVASIFINRMLTGKQPIIYGDGNQKRTFSDVKDCVDPLLKMIDSDRCIEEVINIGPGPENNYLTINELAEIIADLLNFNLNPIYIPKRPQEVKYATCSDKKARLLLGYNPKHKLRDTLQEMIEYIKLRGAKPFSYHIDLEIINERTPITWKEKLM